MDAKPRPLERPALRRPRHRVPDGDAIVGWGERIVRLSEDDLRHLAQAADPDAYAEFADRMRRGASLPELTAAGVVQDTVLWSIAVRAGLVDGPVARIRADWAETGEWPLDPDTTLEALVEQEPAMTALAEIGLHPVYGQSLPPRLESLARELGLRLGPGDPGR